MDSKRELKMIYQRLAKVTDASDQVLNTLFQTDRQVTLAQLAQVVFETLNSESCCVFLVDRQNVKQDEPGELVLEAEYPPPESRLAGPRKVRLKIRSKRGGGLTGHLANKGAVCSLCARQLDHNPYRTKRPPTHHKSGFCYSWLFIPLKDPKDRLIGAISVYNKLGADGKPSRDMCFDKVDILIARILAARILPVLVGMRALAAFNGLMDAMRTAGDMDEFLRQILKVGLYQVGAERGDFAWCDDGRLVTRAQLGEGQVEIGDALPEKSIVYRVWSSRERAVVPDVKQDPDYYEVNSSTRSEVAVPVSVRGRALGVLNAESRTVFDQSDVELLSLLARYAEVGAELLQRQETLRGLDRSVTEQSRQEALTDIVRSLQEIYQFESIVYVADYQAHKLRCIGAALPKALNYEYAFSDRAFATKIFKDRESRYCADPLNDPHVNPKGRAFFGIKTPMVGLPLLASNNCWGVMVVYGVNKPGPQPAHQKQLEPFARLAATAIALTEEEGRTLRMIKAMQTGRPDESLRNVLKAVQQAGFDRVRVFRYDPGQDAFIAHDSIGMSDSDEFLKVTIPLAFSEHSQKLKTHAENSVGALLLNPEKHGQDPYAARLGKPPNLPWAIVPLVIAGNLYGSISADNAKSGADITPDMLKHLTLLGAFAGQAIAASEALAARDRSQRDRFVGDTIHMLKQPITNVAAISEKLSAGKLNRDERMRFEGYLVSEAKKLHRIALQAHHYTVAAMPISKPSRVSLGGLLRECAGAFSATAEVSKVRIVARIPTGDWMFMGDGDRLSVALNQLVENALSFAPPNSTIVLRLESRSTTYRISVSDSGPGVPKDKRSSIFEAFVSLKPAGHEGGGLGLPIARSIVRAHGGEMGCEEGTGGRGACFWFTLPHPPTVRSSK
jgi:signal transduction histidine kinase/putative methionine-R-sulfoxide reductase with GAF domain